MKYTFRVAAPEQYCYIEAEYEGEASEAVAEYHRLNKLMQGGFGLEPKDWNRVIDGYLRDGSMSAEDGEQLSKEQAWLIREIDKSTSRINYKNPKGNAHHSLENN
ncbi:MAG: hypothetical protein WAV09_03590 [Minisyncoccia bacterium]